MSTIDLAATAIFPAALAAGFLGSSHCLLMCGGLSGALGLRAITCGASRMTTMANAVGYQAGRILSYATAGAIFGGAGHSLHSVFRFADYTAVLRAITGILIVGLALKILFRWPAFNVFERWGGKLWRRIAPFAGRMLSAQRPGQSVLLGMVWGWLPCGMVYSMLTLALASGSSMRGAIAMTMFGLGTLPAMLLSTLFAARGLNLARTHRTRLVSGVALLLFGAWTAVSPLTHLSGVDSHGMHADARG